jgi:proteasome lid subunit RPN8/RPN11
MVRLGRLDVERMVEHCLEGYPAEACGLLVGPVGGDVVSRVVPTRNQAASARVYEVHPLDLLRVDREAEAEGLGVVGVFHSHTHSAAYPSPTDVAQAPDPSWHYVLVSLARPEPTVRSYRIVEGTVSEEPIEVTGA